MVIDGTKLDCQRHLLHQALLSTQLSLTRVGVKNELYRSALLRYPYIDHLLNVVESQELSRQNKQNLHLLKYDLCLYLLQGY